MTIHIFTSTGEAYDHTQWRLDIKNGDILLVPSERIAGWREGAWPVAATDEAGQFHRLKDRVSSEATADDARLLGMAHQAREALRDYLDEDQAHTINAEYDAEAVTADSE
ncbi:hypothetical protein [Nocardia sp. NPDC051570]|uniref:hypothetical protein n=1 Tax=Nocardia sp. NPDC051570 TaxID=3364324 RepID=UPI003789BC16